MKIIIMTLVAAAFLPHASLAGPFTDEMSKCLVRNTSEAEKTEFVRWIYAAMSSHPEVKNLSNISDLEARALNRTAADLLVDLLTERCTEETIQAMKYEGGIALEASFGVLGQVAMQELMANPDVNTYFEELGIYFDEDKLYEVLGD